MLRVRTSTSQLFKTATQQITQTNVYSRTFHASVIRREEEEDEDTKAKRLQVEALLKPRVHPTVIPRRRRGLTVETFLEKISNKKKEGRDCTEFKDKFKSWDELFTLKSQSLKRMEIPVKQRRWILNWVEKYRQGMTPGHYGR